MTRLIEKRPRKPKRGCQYVLPVGAGPYLTLSLEGQRCGKPAVALHWPTPAWRCEAHRDAEACCVSEKVGV